MKPANPSNTSIYTIANPETDTKTVQTFNESLELYKKYAEEHPTDDNEPPVFVATILHIKRGGSSYGLYTHKADKNGDIKTGYRQNDHFDIESTYKQETSLDDGINYHVHLIVTNNQKSLLAIPRIFFELVKHAVDLEKLIDTYGLDGLALIETYGNNTQYYLEDPETGEEIPTCRIDEMFSHAANAAVWKNAMQQGKTVRDTIRSIVQTKAGI